VTLWFSKFQIFAALVGSKTPFESVYLSNNRQKNIKAFRAEQEKKIFSHLMYRMHETKDQYYVFASRALNKGVGSLEGFPKELSEKEMKDRFTEVLEELGVEKGGLIIFC
jgi:hypothetical protein